MTECYMCGGPMYDVDEAQRQSEVLPWAQEVFLREFYAAALRDAVEAVSSMVIETVGNSAATVEQAVAAIEALGGER